jgi:hypothetical protein
MTIGPKAAKVKCAFEKESRNKEILRFPAQSSGAKGGQAGGQASGVRKTAKQPYALDGTFRGWWMILLRAQSSDCFRNQQRYPSRTTASRTLRPALAFKSVHQRSAFCISVHECASAVGVASEYPLLKIVFC